MRSFLRYHGFGLATLLGCGGWCFHPYRYVDRIGAAGYSARWKFFTAPKRHLPRCSCAVDGYADDLLAIAKAKTSRWNDRAAVLIQSWFRVDAAVAYAVGRRGRREIFRNRCRPLDPVLARAVADAGS